MRLTTIQWNIGGGKIMQPDQDPTSILSYTVDGLEYIIEFIRSKNPDIITLQEVHKNDTFDQVEHIADRLGMPYHISDFFADSHVEQGQKLGQAIISKYPISNKESDLYFNLNKHMPNPSGGVWHMHDKGYTRCVVTIGDIELHVTTTHLTPLKKFGIAYDSEEGRKVLDDVESKLGITAKHQLIQGDFNLDMPLLADTLPALINNRLDEVQQDTPTTPKGRHYDHVVYAGLQCTDSAVDSEVATDHYPITSTFEIA